MIHWREGQFDENIEVKRDTLYLKESSKSGNWISPIIDFRHYKPQFPILKSSNSDYSYFKFWFRGSNTSPSTTKNNQHALDYYAISSENASWDSNTVSDWTDTMPNFKFLQIKIEILERNYSPKAFADSLFSFEDNLLIINHIDLVTNDFDLDNFPDNLQIKSCLQPINGKLTRDANQNLIYTPNLNFFGEDYFFYNNTDSRDSSNYEKVTVFIEKINDPPIISACKEISILEDSFHLFNIDSLIVEDVDDIVNSNFSFKLFGGKNYQIIDNKIVPNPNFTEKLSVNVQVSDGNSQNNWSNIFTVKINVLPVNDAPTITSQKTISILEDNRYTIRFQDFTVFDIDNNYPVNFTFLLSEGSDYQIVNNQIVPNENYFGEITIPIQVSDGSSENNLSSIFNLKINVLPVNDAPIIHNQQPVSVLEEDTFSISLSDLVYSDIENNSVKIEIGDGENYTVLNQDSIIPNKNFTGILNIPIVLNDQQSQNNLSQIFYFQVEVLPVNDSPVINFPAQIHFYEDNVSDNFSFFQFISDVDNQFNELQIQISGNHFIDVIVENNGFYLKSKNQNWFGNDTLFFEISDGQFSVKDTILVYCNPVNDAPVILNEPLFYKLKNEKQIVKITELSIFDVEESDFTNFSFQLFENENYTVSGDTIIPVTDFVGTLKIPIKVKDSESLESNLSSIFIRYLNVTEIAKIDMFENIDYQEDNFIEFDITPYLFNLSKPLSDIIIKWESDNNLIITEKDKKIKIRSVNENWNGESKIVFYIDNEPMSIPDTVLVKCLPVNDSPTASKTNVIFNEDEFATLNLKPFINDIDNTFDQLNVYFAENENINIVFSDSICHFSAKESNWNGKTNLVFWVTDGEYEISKNIQIEVNPVNDAPEINFPDTLLFWEDESIVFNFENYISDIDDVKDELVLSWFNQNSTFLLSKQDNYEIKILPLSENWNGEGEIIFTVFDGEIANNDTVLIICKPVNDEPFFIVQNTFYFNEDEDLTLEFSKIAHDIDNSLSDLTFQLEGNTQIFYSVENEKFLFSAAPDWFGTETFTLKVNDLESSIQKNITFIVNSVDDAPFFNQTISLNYEEDSYTEVDVFQTVTDIDSPIESFIFTIDSVCENLIVWQNDNILSVRSKNENWNGIGFFYLTAVSNAFQIRQKINVTCNPVNDPPVVLFPDTLIFYEDNVYISDFSRYIFDIDNKKTSFSLDWQDSDNIKIQETNLNVIMSNTPQNWNGEELITFFVSDNSGGFAQKSVHIIVKEINDSPIVKQFSPETENIDLQLNKQLKFEYIAEDYDSEIFQNWYVNDKRIENNENIFDYTFNKLGFFEIKSVIFDNEYQIEKKWFVDVTLDEPQIVIPELITDLLHNAPNPFTETTQIHFTLAQDDYVTLSIYDISGNKVAILIDNQFLRKSPYSITWNATDNFGNKINAGVYIYKLQTSNQSFVKKAVFLKK